MQWCPHMSSQSAAWKKLLVRLSAQSSMSLIHFVLLGMWEMISSKTIMSSHRLTLCNPGVPFSIDTSPMG